MKKELVVFVALFWRFGITAPVSLPILSQELDVLIAELNDLSDDFVDGQLLADASEKKMNLIVLPFFNWFSGINTTNKKSPSTLTLDQIAEYKRLFIKYTKVYGSDDELYDYYNFGKTFITLVDTINILKGDFSVLGIKDVNQIEASKLSQSILAHATAYMAALSFYIDFSKTAQKGFKKPFSVSLSDVYSETTAYAQKVISLKDQIAPDSVIQPFIPPVASHDLSDDYVDGQLLSDASEKKMNLIVLPFFNWFSGISTTNKKNPSTLTPDQIAEYNRLFIKYTKVYGSDDELYDYYNFGKTFLTFINAANILKSDFSALGIKGADGVEASKLSQSILDHANTYVTALSFYIDFSKTAQKGFKKPFSVSLSDVYAEVTACAQKVISLKDQIVPDSVIQPFIPPVKPPVAQTPAQSFILKNFVNDNQLKNLSIDELRSLLVSFSKILKNYTQDEFYSEYKMWAAYVPTRYWEIQFLAGVDGAANAFSLTYLNVFKPAYLKNSNLLRDPYLTQLNAVALEFSVVYANAQVVIHDINNSLYA
jgi:predicted HicB family RNase H-like nuclease